MIKIDNVELYTAKEAAELLKVTEVTIKTYIKQDKLKSQKIGGKHYISKDNIISFVTGSIENEDKAELTATKATHTI